MPEDRALLLSPSQRSLRARAAAFAMHSQGKTSTKAATAASLSRFDRQVDDAAAARGESLTPEERARRVEWARRSHFAKLGLAASRARSRGRKETAPGLEAGAVSAEDHGNDRSAA